MTPSPNVRVEYVSTVRSETSVADRLSLRLPDAFACRKLVRYPTDLGLAADATETLAREVAKAAALTGAGAPRVQDRSRAWARRGA